ncbi:MAG: S8 family serine peptidase, partial [Thermoanaerobaculia bacterium]
MTSLGAKVTRSWFNGRLALVSFHGQADISEALDRLRAEGQVKYAVPNYWLTPAEYIPNDPEFGSQWGLENSDDVDIDAPLAWDQTTGNSSTLVAVMDSGVDYTHPDLYLAIALNVAEIPPTLLSQLVDTNSDGQIDFYDLNSLDESGVVALDGQGDGLNEDLVADLNGNGFIDAGDLMAAPWMDGLDNDGNGSVDDLTGWDHLSNGNDPLDTFGHGTHIAGIISARGNNGLGIAGVNWQSRILPEKFYSSGGGWTSDAIQAIEHAVALGADVINASWGVFANDPALEDAIRWAGENGVVFVAAAGNHSSNNDGSNPYYPASYELPNLISVGSVDPDGNLSDFSNYGISTVHLAAPGRDILSLSLGSGYQLWSGTSMATPHVAGVVSLLAGLYPGVSPDWLVENTLATVKPLPDLMGKVSTGGIVDAFLAVNVPNEGGPRVLSASPTGDVSTSTDRVTLTFDRPIAPSSFSTEDVSIDGPLGSVDPSQINRLTDYVFEVIFPLQEALGEYRLQVGPDIADTIGFVMDQDGDGTPGEPIEDRFDTAFRLQQILIVDDGDAGFTATSGWTTYVGAGAQGDFAYKGAGSGAETA